MPSSSALLQTERELAAVAQRFAAAGWNVIPSAGQARLEIGWGRLTLTAGQPMVLQGWLDRPDDHVGELSGLLSDSTLSAQYQWINAEGRLWREMPFDESMLAPDDPRLPAEIKESIRANRGGSAAASSPRKPWWRFW